MSQFYVYILSDPRTGADRYVGCTEDPERRLSNHVAGIGTDDKSVWCRELRALGVRPILHLHAAYDDAGEAGAAELDLVDAMRARGADLLNDSTIPYSGHKHKKPPVVHEWLPSLRRHSRHGLTSGARALRTHIAACGVTIPAWCERVGIDRLVIQRALNGDQATFSVDFALDVERATKRAVRAEEWCSWTIPAPVSAPASSPSPAPEGGLA